MMEEFLKKEILIVDDEVDFRLALAEMLVDQGYKVTTAKDGVEAIDILINATRLPDLITIDIKMPRQDGLKFKEELLKHNLNRIPLIMISGFVPDQANCLTGIKAVLSKPLNKFELVNTIQYCILNA